MVLKSGLVASGKVVTEFEQRFTQLICDDRVGVAVNSGTAALEMALFALGIGPGDEVIVPSFTFGATANAVIRVGASPVFVDIDPQTFNMDPGLIENAISASTAAIIPVHLFGCPANMFEIMAIARQHSLKVIEDVAQGHGAQVGGKSAGSFGHAAIFSFYPTKNMTTGEGGIALFESPTHADSARIYRNQGMNGRYQYELPGSNLRMTEMQAAIGLVQLEKLPVFLKKRLENAEFLTKHLRGVRLPVVPPGNRHVFNQFTVRVERNRDLIQARLAAEAGIQTEIYYPRGLHAYPLFSKHRVSGNLHHTELAAHQVLSLPVHPSLGTRQLSFLVKQVNRLVAESSAK